MATDPTQAAAALPAGGAPTSTATKPQGSETQPTPPAACLPVLRGAERVFPAAAQQLEGGDGAGGGGSGGPGLPPGGPLALSPEQVSALIGGLVNGLAAKLGGLLGGGGGGGGGSGGPGLPPGGPLALSPAQVSALIGGLLNGLAAKLAGAGGAGGTGGAPATPTT